MKQGFSRWLTATLLACSLMSAISLTGCTGVESEPQGEAPAEDPTLQSPEYLKGEKSIE